MAEPTTVCPRCECPDLIVVDEGIMFGRLRRVYECDYCGKRFTRVMKRAEVTQRRSDEVTECSENVPGTPTRWIYGKPQRCVKCGTMGKVASTRKGFRWVMCPNPDCRQPNWKEPGRAV